MTTTNFTINNPPGDSMQPVFRFLQLLNEKYPIDRSLGNFQGSHAIVLDVDVLIVSVWVWKQLNWRNYLVSIEPKDLALTPEGLIDEVSTTLKSELEKLIVDRMPVSPRPSVLEL